MMRYNQCEFAATHNSYSGEARGSLPVQLDAGIRSVEFDFHDNGYEKFRDYRVGHMGPGAELATGQGNPSGPLLNDWLGVVGQWSAAHPGHTPIAVILDSKDDLTDNANGGDLEDLNAELRRVFGMRLFTPDQYGNGTWPDVADLRGKILCVLSGDAGTRRYYRWTLGSTPSIAANEKGQVVLAYRSLSGDLRCWTGKVQLAATGVQWIRRMTYRFSRAPLAAPAVVLNEDSWVVAVHGIPASREFPSPVVESAVGHVTSGNINWFSTERYALGRSPTVGILGDDIRSIYDVPSGAGRKLRTGKLNRQARRIDWGEEKATTAKSFDRGAAHWQSHVLDCREGSGKEVLVRIDGSRLDPVRYGQVAFIEQQAGDDESLLKHALFFAAHARNQAPLRAARGRGQVVRAWSFAPEDETTPHVNLPATDNPTHRRYQAYLKRSGAVEFA